MKEVTRQIRETKADLLDSIPLTPKLLRWYETHPMHNQPSVLYPEAIKNIAETAMTDELSATCVRAFVRACAQSGQMTRDQFEFLTT